MLPHPLRAALLLLLVNYCCAQRVAPGVNPQHYQQVPQQMPQQHPPPQHQQQQYQQQQQQPQYQQQAHVAPGIPPQQYQQAPVHQQQYQQQQQQAPVQQQQHPQQVHQQPPPPPQHAQQGHHQQQQQQHQQQHGGHHGQPQQVLNTANIEHERAHIQEHMQVPIDTSKMSEAELQFHYFKMHDSDNNNKLDGCELIKSLIHWHVEPPKTAEDKGAAKDGEKHDDHEAKTGQIYTDKALEEVIDYVLKTMDKNNDGFVDYAEYRENEANIGTP